MGHREFNLKHVFQAFFALMLLSATGIAQACTNIDEEVFALLKDKKYQEAEQLALEKKGKAPDDKSVHLNLAYVYFHQAIMDTVSINTRAMGLSNNESGTFELKEENIEKYFSSAISHDPLFGQKTETEFKNIIQRWPNEKTAYLCLMNYYQQAERHDDLLNFAPSVVSAFKSSGYGLVDEFLPYAARYMRDNRPDLAADFYRKLLDLFPKSAPVLSSYGVATLGLGDLDGGLDLFLKAYAQDKKDPLILSNLSEAYIYKQKFEKAEEYLGLLLGVKPEKTEVYFRLAALKMRFGPQDSKEYWAKYLQQNKIHPDHEYWSGLAEKITEAIDRGLADDSLFSLVEKFNRSNASFYSIPILTYLSKKKPDNFYSLFLFSHAYEVGGFPEISYGYAEKAAEMVNGSDSVDDASIASVNYEAGRVAYVLGKFENSLKYFAKTEKHYKNYENLQYMMGMTHHRLSQHKAAIKKYQQCIDMENNKEYAGYCKSNLKELNAEKHSGA